jgi:hypothetical protein
MYDDDDDDDVDTCIDCDVYSTQITKGRGGN